MQLTTEQIDRIIDANTSLSDAEREALRERAHGGDGHARFTVVMLGKRQGVA